MFPKASDAPSLILLRRQAFAMFQLGGHCQPNSDKAAGLIKGGASPHWISAVAVQIMPPTNFPDREPNIDPAPYTNFQPIKKQVISDVGRFSTPLSPCVGVASTAT
ncbi:hypothetical protein B0H13DRAFT_2300136 [Mycena leptocephala]|nr:hypothetical protein B0H13DRAFT_2300136 [Mycena leptocephala]